MQNLARYSFFLVGLVIVAMVTGVLGGCGKSTPDAAVATTQATVPPPPGDSTPKAVDSNASTAMPGNEKSGNAGGSSQSTTGSAASGLPPYSLQSGPEGNPSTSPAEPKPGASTAPNSTAPVSKSPSAPAPETTSTTPNK